MTISLKKTPLHALHKELGAKLVPFAGYEMPVQYPQGIMTEHLHTRQAAGLFDVSHMGQIAVRGKQAAQALESLMPADIIGLQPYQQKYALLTNDSGGIRDDLMVTSYDEFLLLVVNAACKEQDWLHMQTTIGAQCELTMLAERALLALQGPRAAEVLAGLWPQLADLVFMQAAVVEFQGEPCWISRSGYTGEDGFEMSVPAQLADALARQLVANPQVMPVGLGARDSLRLEAGLCLYGHDIDTETTPVAAGLQWAIAPCRRAGAERAGGFPGADRIGSELQQGVDYRRVGIKTVGKVPIREHAQILDQAGRQVGKVTSGGYGPSVAAPIAMGYVESRFASGSETLFALVRGKQHAVRIAELPFVKPRYYRGHTAD